MMGDELLDEADTAARFKVPAATLRQWRYLNQGPPYFKIGRHVRYSATDLTAWLSEHRRAG